MPKIKSYVTLGKGMESLPTITGADMVDHPKGKLILVEI